MDYEFVCKGEGLPVARLAMGQAAFGHWLNDEIGYSRSRIDEVLQAIARLAAGEQEQWSLPGRVYSLHLDQEEAEVAANVVRFDFPDELEPDMAYYDEEQMAGGGLEDLRHLLLSWLAFVTAEGALQP
jgi:uncharacterized protein YacL (UPF0231 family)